MTTADDSERTVVVGNGRTAAAVDTGTDRSGEYAQALPVATRLHEFEIVSVIGQGGFGIVYLAHDLTLDRRVAIKEYMPSSLAVRTQAMTVAVRSERHADTFAAGLRSFVNEARLLAQFDHPSLVKVHRFWEAHGTAYMVMPYYAGVTLAGLLAEAGAPPDEAWLKALLHQLLDALALLHAAHCFHRDIAPDNILMLPDGRPLLLDFGAARRVIGDLTHALTVILKPGYAPVEQYGDMPEMAQGPWTDLYALGSVVHFAITGHTPPQAVARFMTDRYRPLAVVAAGRYDDAFLTAVDRCLSVLPKDRPQSVAEMRAAIGAPAEVHASTAGRQAETLPAAPPMDAGGMSRSTAPSSRLCSDGGTAPPPAPLAAPVRDDFRADAAPAAARQVSSAPPEATRQMRRRLAAAAAAVLFAMLAAAGLHAWLGRRGDAARPPAAQPTATPAPEAMPAPAPPVRPTAPSALPGPC